MKNIFKIFILSLILFLFYNTCDAQVYKLRAYEFSYKTYSYYSGWSEWSDWSNCQILVVVDIDNYRIKIYSQSEQEYDIIETESEQTDYKGNKTTKMVAIDKDGSRCNVRIRTDVNLNKQLYIDYSDMMWVYNVYNLN